LFVVGDLDPEVGNPLLSSYHGTGTMPRVLIDVTEPRLRVLSGGQVIVPENGLAFGWLYKQVHRVRVAVDVEVLSELVMELLQSLSI